MKISHKVPLIGTTIILAAFTIFGFFQYKSIQSNIKTQIDNNIEEVSHAVSAEISVWLNNKLQVVSAMTEIIGNNPDANNIKDIMGKRAFAPDVRDYYAALKNDGGRLIANKDFDLPEDWDARTRPWYKLALRTNKPIFTLPYVDIETNKLLVTAAAQLGDQGVLGADIALNVVSDALAIDFNNTGYAYLVDANGTIITHPDNKYYNKNISTLYDANASSLLPTLQTNTIDNKEVMTAFHPLKDFNGSEDQWYIGVVLDKEKVFAPARILTLKTAIIAVVTAIISSIVFYAFMLVSLISPVKRLVQQSDDISRGKLADEIEGANRKDEIGELSQAIKRMQKALEIAMGRLKAK